MLVDGERVELQLFTTLECNKSCRYCSEGVGDVLNSQSKIGYTLDQLDKFVKTHFPNKEFIVTFYGGEPLLNPQFIEDVMGRFPLWRCQLQTNGTLLHTLSPFILNRFDNILISVDGDKEVTDLYRGEGTYDIVNRSLDKVRDLIPGYITARCTWANPHPKAIDIIHLSNLFDYVYFQFPHNEWVYDYEYMKVMKKALEDLVEYFFTAKLLKIIPLMAFARNMLFPSRAKELYGGKTQCRVSSHLFNILPDGTITSCPDYAYNKKMTHGSVVDNVCEKNPLQYSDSFPCKSCVAFDVCRVNCVKGFHQCYIETDKIYKSMVLDSCCSFILYLYKLFKEKDLVGWYTNLTINDKRELLNCPIYEYIEVMP